MPQSSNRVASVDLAGDMNDYYRGCVVTYNRRSKDGEVTPVPALVEKFTGESEVRAHLRILPNEDGAVWSSLVSAPYETLDFVMPPLGLVQVPGGTWVHVYKSPARRKRKGYHPETVHLTFLENDRESHFGGSPLDSSIVRQIWYGNPDRIALNVTVWGKGVYYAADLVATVDKDGGVCLIPGKEKLGEFVCKTLANNWDLVVSKYSVRTLPSSLQMP